MRLDTWTFQSATKIRRTTGWRCIAVPYFGHFLLQESHAVGKASASFQFVVLVVLEAGVVTNIRWFIPR